MYKPARQLSYIAQLCPGSCAHLELSCAEELLPWEDTAKRPFGNPEAVVEYLGRYTHKIAISNHRIKFIDGNGGLTCCYKDYRKKAAETMQKMKLEGIELLNSSAGLHCTYSRKDL